MKKKKLINLVTALELDNSKFLEQVIELKELLKCKDADLVAEKEITKLRERHILSCENINSQLNGKLVAYRVVVGDLK